MNFSEKVKKQKRKEQEIFRLSCELIEETALGSGDKNLKKNSNTLSTVGPAYKCDKSGNGLL